MLYFIIPVYKVEAYLSRCVDSVLAQSISGIEVVLIDDGSPDRCPEICDRYKEAHGNIEVIHKKNGGLSDARNAGLRYVMERAGDADYITFLDSDDYVHPQYAEKMLRLCGEYSCDMAQCGYEKGSADRFSAAQKNIMTHVMDAEDALLGYELKSQMFGKVFRASVFSDLFFPVGRLNEDEFVVYIAAYRAKRIAFTNEKLHYYYRHGETIMESIAKKLKGNPHRYDYLEAYKERAEFFARENKPEQVMRTYEKVCTDIILRYSEQMYLKKDERDEDCVDGTYMRIYRENFKRMIKRRGIPVKRRIMYTGFYIIPHSAVVMGKIFGLRK